jgi:hypothetical protein
MPVPNAVASFVVWVPAPLEAGTGLHGEPLDVVRVHGGELVRLQPTAASPLEVGERFEPASESWSRWPGVSSSDAAIVLRANAFASAIVVRRGAISRAYVGHASDPGYYFFDLERRVLAWANGDLPALFPQVASPERIDLTGFAELDRVLAQSVANAKDRPAALAAARAIRRVAGLRAVRALRPMSGYPYFFDEQPSVLGGARAADGAYLVSPESQLEVVASGPALLSLFANASAETAANTLELRVLEGGRERARSFNRLAAGDHAHSGPHSGETAPGPALRHALVHVPPGVHRYHVRAYGGPASVRMVLAKPVVHVEDVWSGEKDEDTQLTLAQSACAARETAPLCLLALALLAADEAHGAGDGGAALDWRAASAASPSDVRQVAEELASGGPRDPTLRLEWSASGGDHAALAALSALAQDSVDDVTRRAWAHAVRRGARWMPSEAAPDAPTWITLRDDPQAADTTSSQACAETAREAWPELGVDERVVRAEPWHGANTIEILAAVGCDDSRPLELIVDGQHLLAQPSASVARWHIRVRGDSARVRRADGGSGHLYVLTPELAACGGRYRATTAPLSAASAPQLQFGAGSAAAGLEVWLRAGTDSAQLQVTATAAAPQARALRLVVRASPGPTAIDARGQRFTRVARVPLPAWAAHGVTVTGADDVAVSALAMVARDAPQQPTRTPTAAPAAEPLNEGALIALSREILAATPTTVGPLYLHRALLLARAGAARAALEDARSARAFGARADADADPEAAVRAAIRPRRAELAPLPADVLAYAIEADFDPDARRCAAGQSGPRATLARAAAELATTQGKPEAAFTAALAARTLTAAEAAPLDPRSPSLVARALAGSRWKLKNDVAGDAARVSQTLPVRDEGPLDPDGGLRPNILAGQPFAAGTFALVTPERPAQARIVGGLTAVHGRIELVCVAQAPPEAANTRCPIEVKLGEDAPLTPTFAADGRASVPFAVRASLTVPLAIAMAASPGRFVALTRIVFEQALPHTQRDPDGSWVLTPQRMQHRFGLSGAERLSVRLDAPGVLRVEAVAANGGVTHVLAHLGGRERSIPSDGTPVVLPMPEAGTVVLEVREGSASVTIAERVPREVPERDELSPARETAGAAVDAEPMQITLAASSSALWAERATTSPRPLTPFEASLGTVAAALGAVASTMREGQPYSSSPDTYAFGILAYRRRIESIGLWTAAEVFGRARAGEPTYGGTIGGYEEITSLHLRLSAELGLAAQRIDRLVSQTWKPRAFVEYSWRVTHNFFVLPRLGYDGVYTPVPALPKDLSLVDDGVYNQYRAKHPTFVFAQALLWFAPHFNDIFYLRARASVDPNAANLNHLSSRPGVFVAFGDLDLSAFVEATWRAATSGITRGPTIEQSAGLIVTYDFWSGLGSLDVQPGAAGFVRSRDGGWQVNVFVNLLASARRGLRDFSSLTLDFPEQLSGGIPWRGNTPGGYR